MLSPRERVGEVARMLGGAGDMASAMSHADTMLRQAAELHAAARDS